VGPADCCLPTLQNRAGPMISLPAIPGIEASYHKTGRRRTIGPKTDIGQTRIPGLVPGE
jgi:hypothetical protein